MTLQWALEDRASIRVTRIRVLHLAMELITALPPLLPGEGWGEVKKSTVQRKPFGCAIARFIFPSEHKNLQQHHPGDPVDKMQAMAIHEIREWALRARSLII